MRGRVQAGHPAPGETKRSVCCSVVTRGHSCPTAGRICVEGQWPPSPRDEDRERHLPTLGQCWQITSRCLFRPRLSHRLDLVLQLSGFLLVPSFPGTSPTSQEPAPAAVSCAGSGRVGVCCSSGRAGAGQDLGTRGRCLHRQAELSVLAVMSQQDPPFFFSFPFSMLLILYLAGRSQFQTGGHSPFPQRCCCCPGPSVAQSQRCSLPSLALTRAGAGVSVLVLHQGTAAQGPSLWPFTGRSQHWETSKQKPLDKLRASPGGVGHPSSAAPSLFLGAQGGFGALPGPHPGSGPAAAACQAKGPRRGSCCHRADGESFCLAFPRGDAITRCCHPSTQGFATARPAAGARPCSLLLFHTTPAAPGMAELPRGRGEPRPVCAGAWPRGAARPWWGLTCAGLPLQLPPPTL